MRGEEVVAHGGRTRTARPNRGHSCVKGRFAWGYTTHKERILKPMIRDDIADPWREVSWDEAFNFPRGQIQGHPAKIRPAIAVGGITSSRCTNEEVYVVQKLIRGGFWQQQCRYLRPRLPFADRLWPLDDVRHLGRHSGFRLGRNIPTSS